MFKTVEQLKEFIMWAKTQQIKQVKIKGVDVTFSDLALVEQYEMNKSQSSVLGSVQEMIGSMPRTEEQLKKEEEDLLFHSSQ